MEHVKDPDTNSTQYLESSSHLALNSKISYTRDYSEYGLIVKPPDEDHKSNSKRKYYSDVGKYNINNKSFHNKNEQITIDEMNGINLTKSNDLISRTAEIPYSSCSKYQSLQENVYANLEAYYSRHNLPNGTNYYNDLSNNTSNQVFDDKATYCYSKYMTYDSEFVYRTIQNNAKLQNLLQKLILLRRRDNDEIWNNYIKNLKDKHSKFKPTSNSIESHPKTKLINNDCKSSYKLSHTNQHHNILQHSHTSNKCIQYGDSYDNQSNDKTPLSSLSRYYQNDFYCYPMSSQGRLMMLKKRKELNYAMNWQCRPVARNFRKGVIVAERENCVRKRPKIPCLEDKYIQTSNIAVCCSDKSCGTHEEYISWQTSIEHEKNTQKPSTASMKIPRIQHKVVIKEPGIEYEDAKDSVSSSSNTIERNKMQTSASVKNPKIKMRELDEKLIKNHEKSLTKVEEKLDNLIKSVNKFLSKMKNITINRGTSTISCKCADTAVQSYELKCASSRNSVRSKEHAIYNVTQGTTRSAFTLSDLDRNKSQHNSSSKIDKLLQEEMEKSNKIKNDIESLLRLQSFAPYSIRFALETPTTDICTEVTSSLSITKISTPRLKEVGCLSDNTHKKSLAMAVNTEPMCLYTIIKMSTDIIKQILSFMPQIDYYSFLPALQFRQIPRNCVPHYICTICGAVFGRPSQLSGHIQKHNSGNTRDCCVCRHTVDHSRKRLFGCEYCGKLFTRAYCCELHQRSCARQLGRVHDVPSSHLYLK